MEIKGDTHATRQRPLHPAPPPGDASEATDPVCGMAVAMATAKHRTTHDGAEFYFCSAGCLGKFRANPLQYRNAAEAVTTHVPAGAIYTCEWGIPNQAAIGV